MLCVVCGADDGTVVACAECTNGCTVVAHETCFFTRRTSPAWRKKHGTRDNREAEVCPHAGCVGRLKVRATRAKDGVAPAKTVRRAKDGAKDAHRASGGAWCLHTDRHGLPCTRPVHAHGACAVHVRTMQKRRAVGERLLAAALAADDRVDAQTQT